MKLICQDWLLNRGSYMSHDDPSYAGCSVHLDNAGLELFIKETCLNLVKQYWKNDPSDRYLPLFYFRPLHQPYEIEINDDLELSRGRLYDLLQESKNGGVLIGEFETEKLEREEYLLENLKYKNWK